MGEETASWGSSSSTRRSVSSAAATIGSIVADRALGLKMRVIAYDPFLSPERAIEIGVEKVELDDIFRRSDFITLHTPLTDKTATSSTPRRSPG